MTRFQKFILVLLAAIAVPSMFGAGVIFYENIWKTPLGSPLSPFTTENNLSGSTPTQGFGAQISSPSTTNLPQTYEKTLTTIYSTGTISTKKAPLCNGPESMKILAIGSDTRANNYLYGLSDVIRYVRIDFTKPQISVLEFPRDLWVEIPGISDHYGITHGKLNQAYLYGNAGMGYYQGDDAGPGLLAKTLNLNFSAQPDHYIAANMQTFVRLVDAVGGIDVNLPYSVDARKPDQKKRKDLFFAAGFHHLDGEQALMLGRIREFSVFGRADQQNRILCGLKKELISPKILLKLPDVITSFYGSVQTDLSPEQISQIACLIPKLNSKDILFTTFPRELLTESRTYDIGVKKDVYIFKADFEILKTFVSAFDNGTWPIHNSDPVTSTPSPAGEGTFICP